MPPSGVQRKGCSLPWPVVLNPTICPKLVDRGGGAAVPAERAEVPPSHFRGRPEKRVGDGIPRQVTGADDLSCIIDVHRVDPRSA